MEQKKFSKRAFSALVMGITGILLSLSGIMNHKIQYDSMTLEKHLWMSIHDSSAMLFLIFTIVHISFNWCTLKKYVNKAKNSSISKEAISALAVVLIIVGLISSHAFLL